jgi:hypothetical protein
MEETGRSSNDGSERDRNGAWTPKGGLSPKAENLTPP